MAKTAWLIDDNKYVIEGLASELAEKGYEVTRIFTTADDAIQFVENSTERPTIIIFDNNTESKYNGLDLLKILGREEDCKTKTTLLVMLSGDEVKSRAKRLGAHLFIEKPYEDEDIDRLDRMVEKVMREHGDTQQKLGGKSL